MSFLRSILEFTEEFVLGAPWRVIARAGVPYLTRFHLADVPQPWGFPFRLYLHKFHRSDDDVELHNHPWKWAVSLVLAGGYREERREVDVDGSYHVVERDVMPGNLNWIFHDTFHRVDLYERDAWTLFLVGPRIQDWGFWDRVTEEFTPWQFFVGKK